MMKHTFFAALFLSILGFSQAATSAMSEKWAGATESISAGADAVVQVANEEPVELRAILEQLHATVTADSFLGMVQLSVAKLGSPMGDVVASIAADIMGVDADILVDPMGEHLIDFGGGVNSPS